MRAGSPSAARPPACELVFTTGEEVGLRGARAFDVARSESPFGFVLDHAAPIGRMVLAAPTYYRVHAEFLGRSAHAGIRPEEGRSAIAAAAAKAIDAMQLGRIDDETTANVGAIHGGTAANVVPERCVIEAEVRSLDDAKASEGARQMVDAITYAASATEIDVDTTVEEQFRAYRIPEDHPGRGAGGGGAARLRRRAGADVDRRRQRRERASRRRASAA